MLPFIIFNPLPGCQIILSLIRSEECGSNGNKERYLREISDYVDQKEVFGINSCHLLLSFGLEAHRNFNGGLGL